MADWTKPTLSSNYTNFVTEIKDRDIDNAVWFEGSSSTGIPTNSKRLNTSTGRFEKWTGTAWVDAVSTFTFPALSVAGAFTVSGNTSLSTMTASGDVTLNGGTANGVPYLNGSKVLTTGSALTFDGTNLGIGTSSPTARLTLQESASSPTALNMLNRNSTQRWALAVDAAAVDDKILAFIDQTNTVVRMALDSSGNLGLGVTPSAWVNVKAFEIKDGGQIAAAGPYLTIGSNEYFNGTNYIYKLSDYAARYGQEVGVHKWYIAPSGTAGNAISFTQAMTLDASGNLGIGTTSASARVHALGTGTSNVPTIIANSNRSATNAGVFSMYGYNASTVEKEYARLYATIDTNTAGSEAGSMVFQTINAGTLAERARIDSSGQMSTTNAAGAVFKAYDARAWVNFNGTGTVAIRASGNLTSITDNGVGDYSVNYTTAMSNANYSTNVTAVSTASGNTNVIAAGLYAPSTAGVGASSATTSSVRVSTRTSSGNQIDTDCVNVAVFL